MPAGGKAAWIWNQRLYGHGNYRSGPRDRRKAPHAIIALCLYNNGAVKLFDLLVEAFDLTGDLAQGKACPE